eukprot:3543385-Prymnesium_polylepis.1
MRAKRVRSAPCGSRGDVPRGQPWGATHATQHCPTRVCANIRELRNKQFVNIRIHENEYARAAHGVCDTLHTTALNCPMPMVQPMVSLPSHLPACKPWMSVSYEVVIYIMFQPYISCGVSGAKMENSRERNRMSYLPPR